MKRSLLLLLAISVPSSAMSYEWIGAKWALQQGDAVNYVVNEALSADLPDMPCLEAVQLGYNAWTGLSCSYMSWRYEGRTNNAAWGSGDGENVVSWREASWDDSPAALAITSTIWGGINNYLQDADIKFNGFHHSWAHFGEDVGRDGRSDIASVSAHEVGHASGLGHSNIAGSTMWPSTGPGDTSGRSLGADDISGVCELYPSGGEIPEPDVDPPTMVGSVDFGDACGEERCAEDLFCLNDGRDLYCSRTCIPGDDSCGDGYYCAFLSGGGGGACVRGEDPRQNLAGFGEDCGQGTACEQGLVCVNDSDALYCTGPCSNGMCPQGYFCATLQDGDSICARGEADVMGELPGQGERCTDRGICSEGLFCLNDPTNIDEETGRPVAYCTSSCPDNQCEAGFRCVDVNPSGTACQRIPTAGQREMGDECWVNPERPWERPTCGDPLVCVNYVIENQMVVEPGICTRNCLKDDCCPEGWGCIELTPRFGQCQANKPDSPRFECEGVRPGNDAGISGGAGDGGGPRIAASGDSGGCTQTHGSSRGGLQAVLLLLVALCWRRRLTC
jgi:hypothetical protein